MRFENTRFLIIRLSSIGDVLHATTVAHNLRAACPASHITWLVSPPASELLRYNPDIDELLIWDRRRFDHALANFHLADAKKTLDELRHIFAVRTFDIVLDIQCLFLTGLIAQLSHTKRRIGIYDRHEFNQLFMTERGPRITDPHKIRHYMTVLAPLGIHTQDTSLILNLPKNLIDFADCFFSNHNINAQHRILMINIRTTWPDKNWPLENFIAVLNNLSEKIQIIFCGTAEDHPYIQKIRTSLDRDSVSIAGKTSLLELAALFRKADLLLTGDTGPLYIAAAAGIPTLSLWGPTHPAIYGPLTGKNTFLVSPYTCIACCKTKCRYKTNACMKAITPEMVKNILYKLLNLPSDDISA
jgi:ADP-heptose:LPS heptosyltransferase